MQRVLLCRAEILSTPNNRRITVKATSIWADPPKSPRGLSVVRLRRRSRPSASRQTHCAAMDLTIQGATLLHLIRIRIRCVCCVIKKWRERLRPYQRSLARFPCLAVKIGRLAPGLLSKLNEDACDCVALRGLACRSFEQQALP